MKKLFALMLALCLLGSVAMAGELVWAGDAEEAASQIEGEFHTIKEGSLKVWIPAVLQESELTEEDKEEGIIANFETADGEAGVFVQYYDLEGMSLDEYAEDRKENDAEEIEAGTVNGLPCLAYKLDDSAVMAFALENGYVLEFVCGPMDDEGFASVAALILSSIQAN